MGVATGSAEPFWEVTVLAAPLAWAPQTCVVGTVSPTPAHSRAHAMTQNRFEGEGQSPHPVPGSVT